MTSPVTQVRVDASALVEALDKRIDRLEGIVARRLVACQGECAVDVSQNRDASGSSMGGTSQGRGAAAGRSAAAPVTAQALIQFIEDTLGIGLFPWQHAEVERTFGDFR